VFHTLEFDVASTTASPGSTVAKVVVACFARFGKIELELTTSKNIHLELATSETIEVEMTTSKNIDLEMITSKKIELELAPFEEGRT